MRRSTGRPSGQPPARAAEAVEIVRFRREDSDIVRIRLVELAVAERMHRRQEWTKRLVAVVPLALVCVLVFVAPRSDRVRRTDPVEAPPVSSTTEPSVQSPPTSPSTSVEVEEQTIDVVEGDRLVDLAKDRWLAILGTVPSVAECNAYVAQIARRNELVDPNRIDAGSSLVFPVPTKVEVSGGPC